MLAKPVNGSSMGALRSEYNEAEDLSRQRIAAIQEHTEKGKTPSWTASPR
jgi:hypothetical protein